jgi:hypothetical protein
LVFDGRDWSALPPCCFTPRETVTGNHWMRGCVGCRADVSDLERSLSPLSVIRLYLLYCPGCSLATLPSEQFLTRRHTCDGTGLQWRLKLPSVFQICVSLLRVLLWVSFVFC